MTDPFAWIDPFEEIEAARQQVGYARAAGRQDALKFVADNNTGEFDRALRRTVEMVAMKIAREYIEPMLREHYRPYIDYQARQDEVCDQFLAISQPIVGGIVADGELTFDMVDRFDREPHMTVSYELAKPFRYNFSMMPDWRHARRRA